MKGDAMAAGGADAAARGAGIAVAVEGVAKRFGGFAALDGVSIDARPGEFLALLGPSGSGKTTLLRCIAGLEFPDAGRIAFDGEDVSARRAGDRRAGFVFQHYALFRHMTVAKNIAFPMEVRRDARPAKAAVAARVAELLALVQLSGLAGRYPSQLSGGQRQRVALARALAADPTLLLLDEPFGALDATVRRELRRWLRELHETVGLTSLFVTHDQEEALELADRVVVMNDGRIEQVGTPSEVYDAPATGFVCRFLGDAAALPARLEGDAVEIAGRRFPNAAGAQAAGVVPGTAYVRSHDWAADPQGLPVTIRRLLRVGGSTLLDGRLPDGTAIEARLREVPAGAAAGATVTLSPRVVRGWADC